MGTILGKIDFFGIFGVKTHYIVKKTNKNIPYKYMAKKVKKEACYTDAIWRKILKISPPEWVIIEIFGQISPIWRRFPRVKKNKYTLSHMTNH